jgi:ABC-type dipeptide/oligopeptide/nickel transport system ATPase component
VPSPLDPPPGCTFHPRCAIAVKGICDVDAPALRPVEADPGHEAACHLRTGDHTHLDPAPKG